MLADIRSCRALGPIENILIITLGTMRNHWNIHQQGAYSQHSCFLTFALNIRSQKHDTIFLFIFKFHTCGI